MRWVLEKLVSTPAAFVDLIENMDQSVIPQDHQEDPGAVPNDAFGPNAAFAAEMRAILDPVKRRHTSDADDAGKTPFRP